MPLIAGVAATAAAVGVGIPLPQARSSIHRALVARTARHVRILDIVLVIMGNYQAASC